MPSVTRVVICVSRAFLLNGPKRETARSLHLAFFIVFVNTLCPNSALYLYLTVLCSVVKHAGGG